MSSLRSRAIGLVLLGAYALLVAAWLFANPPFAAPDEGSHYLRALALSEGQVLGAKAPAPGPFDSSDARHWVQATTREVRIPRGYDPRGFDCMTYEPDRSAACLDKAGADPRVDSAITPVGTYPPLPYVVPAVTLRLAHSPAASLRLGRVGMALVWLLLCLVALRAAWTGPPPAAPLFAAIALVLTPTTVFLGGTLNGSAIEVMSSVAFLIALLRVGRAAAPSTTDWLAVAAAGALLGTARSSGPVWLLFDSIVLLAFLGRRAFGAGCWRQPAAISALAVVGAGLLFGLGWQLAVGPDAPVTPFPALGTLGDGFKHTLGSLREAVGGFDYLEFRLPVAIAVPWLLLATIFVGAALRFAEGRERIALAAVSAAGLLLPAYLYAAAISHTGFGIQGRTMLPLFIPPVLLAGDVLRRRPPPRATRQVVTGSAAIIGLLAVLQVAAWWVNSRRFAVGLDGPIFFFARAEWEPPLGWAPWLVLIGAGAALTVTAALLLARGGTKASLSSPG